MRRGRELRRNGPQLPGERLPKQQHYLSYERGCMRRRRDLYGLQRGVPQQSVSLFVVRLPRRHRRVRPGGDLLGLERGVPERWFRRQRHPLQRRGLRRVWRVHDLRLPDRVAEPLVSHPPVFEWSLRDERYVHRRAAVHAGQRYELFGVPSGLWNSLRCYLRRHLLRQLLRRMRLPPRATLASALKDATVGPWMRSPLSVIGCLR